MAAKHLSGALPILYSQNFKNLDVISPFDKHNALTLISSLYDRYAYLTSLPFKIN
jgi:hypothetical protein